MQKIRNCIESNCDNRPVCEDDLFIDLSCFEKKARKQLSIIIQKAAFSKGYTWVGGITRIAHTEQPYLVIHNDRLNFAGESFYISPCMKVLSLDSALKGNFADSDRKIESLLGHPVHIAPKLYIDLQDTTYFSRKTIINHLISKNYTPSNLNTTQVEDAFYLVICPEYGIYTFQIDRPRSKGALTELSVSDICKIPKFKPAKK